MTVYYVDSAAGSNTSPYDTWAKAATALATITAIDAAGDTIYVASTHAESSASNLTFTYNGTHASPTRIVCADKTSGEPPSTQATGGSITTTSGATIFFSGSGTSGAIYIYGITLISNLDINLGSTNGGQRILCEQCSFQLTSGSGRVINPIGNSLGNQTRWRNCDIKFAHATHHIRGGGIMFWEGGSILSGSTAPTALMNFGTGVTATSLMNFSGIDLSNGGSSLFLNTVTNGNGISVIRNCKMPTSWTNTNIVTGTKTGTSRFEYYNCDSGDTNYRFGIEAYSATMFPETTLVKTGGASDGTTPISWKVVTNANATFTIPFRTTEIVKWNSTTGSSITVTVDILHDSATAMTDREIWLEVMYMGTSGVPLGTWINDGANFVSSGTAQTSSSSTWTTTGMSDPNKQQLSVSFTPQKAGYIHAYVVVTKTSKTVYIDPELVVT